jgi:hypothetical protein
VTGSRRDSHDVAILKLIDPSSNFETVKLAILAIQGHVPRLADALHRLEREGLIIAAGGCWRLTPKGRDAARADEVRQ